MVDGLYHNTVWKSCVANSTEATQHRRAQSCRWTLLIIKAEQLWCPQQATLGPRQSCSRAKSETSLSSSVAAGIIALTLDAK